MLKLGSRAHGWIGLAVALAGQVGEYRHVVGDDIATAAQLVGLLYAALFGGALVRPASARTRDVD